MKSHITFFMFLLILCPLFGQDINTEKAEIEALIRKQGDSFRSLDFQAYQNVWAHEPYIVRVTQNGNWKTGWDSVAAYYKNVFEYLKSQKFKSQYDITDLQIHIAGNSAWAIHHQHDEDFINGNLISSDQINTRFFEKKGGQWKIVFNATELLPQQNFAAFEAEFNELGYRLLNMGKVDEAIKTFKLNVQYYPNSSNVYDSLGEAYMKKGESELAIQNYKKSLELNPDNTNAIKMIKKMSTK